MGGGGRFGGGGPVGRFMGGAAFQASPLLALSAHYGGPAGAAGAMSVIAGTHAIKTYAEYEDAIRWVKILQKEAGATEAQLQMLEQQSRSLGQTTVYSATEAAQAMSVLTKRGFDALEVYRQMPSVLSLAAAGEMDIAEAAEIVGATQKQFKLEAKDTQQIVDMLAKAALDSASDVQSIGHALSYVGVNASNAGMSLKETLSVIMLLEDAGLKSSRAGTGLSRVLAKLANEKTQKIFANFGVDVKDANGNLRDMDSLVADIQKSLQGMSGLDRFGFATSVFRERGGLSFATIMNEEAATIKENMDALSQSAGASANVAQQRLESLKNQAKLLTDAYAELEIQFGETFGPVMVGAVKQMTAAMQAFTELPQQTEREEARRRDLEEFRRDPEAYWRRRRAENPPPPTVFPTVPRPAAAPAEPAPGAPIGGLFQTGRGLRPGIDRTSGVGRGFGALGLDPAPAAPPEVLIVNPRAGALGAGGAVSGGVAGGLAGLGVRDAERERSSGEVRQRPQFTAIEELGRAIQLGVLDKKDRHLSAIEENTEKTKEGINELNRNLGSGLKAAYS